MNSYPQSILVHLPIGPHTCVLFLSACFFESSGIAVQIRNGSWNQSLSDKYKPCEKQDEHPAVKVQGGRHGGLVGHLELHICWDLSAVSSESRGSMDSVCLGPSGVSAFSLVGSMHVLTGPSMVYALALQGLLHRRRRLQSQYRDGGVQMML